MKSNQDTVRIFFEAFSLVGEDKPVSKISVSEVASKAGYNRSTFYEYFDDIEDLYNSLESFVISEVKQNFEEVIKKSDFRNTFLAAFEKIQKHYSMYFNLLMNRYNYFEFSGKLIHTVSPILISNFSLPKDHPRSYYLVEVYFHTVLTALKYWIIQKRSTPLSELSDIIQKILTNGVVSEILSSNKHQ